VDSSPDPFKQHASGLYVPEAHARTREVWTRDEMRLLDKVTALLKSRRVAFQFRCDSPQCDDRTMVRRRDPAGHIVLECGCKDRHFTTL
jgi:hypothetical protein